MAHWPTSGKAVDRALQNGTPAWHSGPENGYIGVGERPQPRVGQRIRSLYGLLEAYVIRLTWSAPIVAPAQCPNCQCDIAIPLMRATRTAGRRTEAVGRVCDCVRCGCRYTALYAGGVVALDGRAAMAARPEPVAATPGGHGTGRPGWLDSDMVTLDTPTGA